VSKRNGVFAAMVLVVCASAQDAPSANVKGRLHGEGQPNLRGYVIELEHLGAHGSTIHADVEFDGEFSFRGIPTGEYVLRVTTYLGQALSQQFASIHDRTATLDVRLPAERPSPAGRTVSLGELRHPPSRKAFDASLAAQRFAESGNFDKAAGELEKAVRISPDYAAAHSNLAVQYLRLQRYEEARAEIGRAMGIAGPNGRDLANLAFALAALRRIPESVEAAKGALRVDRDNAAAHYILGTLLTLDRETRVEGVAHLELAAKTLESARKALARFTGAAD
jgi:tetratricopeptide (TPR) repeat protein